MTDKGTLLGIATRGAKRAPMIGHDAVRIFAESGLAGDFGRKPGKSQVTVLSQEKWDAACADVGAVIPWMARRGNLFVSGIALDVVAGRRLAVGAVVLEITGETDPCHRMDEAYPGLRNALMPHARGGVRCRVIQGGWVRIGDAVSPVDGASDEGAIRFPPAVA